MTGWMSIHLFYRIFLHLVLFSAVGLAFRSDDVKRLQPRRFHSTRHRPTYVAYPADHLMNDFAAGQEIVSLYDILGVSSSATQQEIKKAYFGRAKETHPDARRSKDGVSVNNDMVLDFSDVAAAYKLLSDPKERKRYDRAVQAHAFKEGVGHLATQFAEEAYPAINSLMENVAVPFLRRTTATTLAAATKLADNPSSDWKDAFAEAVGAANRAGKMVDGMELLEKYEELERRARKSVNQAYNVKKEIDSVSNKRMNMILHVPDATITSTDAIGLLKLWGVADNAEDHVSIFDLEMWTQTVRQGIAELQNSEQVLLQKNLETREVEIELSKHQKAHEESQTELDLAVRAEYEAQQNLAAAQVRLQDAKVQIQDSKNALSNAEVWSKKTFMERDRLFKQLRKKQDKVRVALRRKKGHVIRHKPQADVEDFNFQEEISLSDLSKVKEEEKKLQNDYSQLADQAAALLNRANKLKEKAKQIESSL